MATGSVTASRAVPGLLGRTGGLFSFSSCGRFLISRHPGWSYLSSWPPRHRTDLIIWSASPPLEELGVYPGEAFVAPAGNVVAYWGEGEELIFVTLGQPAAQTSVPAKTLTFKVFHEAPALGAVLTISPDGSSAVAESLSVEETPSFISRWVPDLAKNQAERVSRLWGLPDGEEMAVFEDFQTAYYSPDGKRLAVNQGETITIWEVHPDSPDLRLLALPVCLWLGVLVLCGLFVAARFWWPQLRRLSAPLEE